MSKQNDTTRPDRSETKYGDQLADHGWSTDDDDAPAADRTTIKSHEIEVIYTTDPQESDGYGREKYSVTVDYDDETGAPYVLYAIEYRWKGNYWRDVTDWDWRDIPGPVRERIAAALPVESPDDLDCGARLMDEGGESRWEKHHKTRIQTLDGDEMWGSSFLRDALEHAETAAEAFDDGSRGEDLAEGVVEEIQEAIRTVKDADSEDA